MDDRRKLELAGWAVGAFVLVLLGLRFLHHGSPAAAPVSIGAADTASPATAAHAESKKLLVVDVEGEVARPGVQRVAGGSRAAAAVVQAGGQPRRGDATAVNL